MIKANLQESMIESFTSFMLSNRSGSPVLLSKSEPMIAKNDHAGKAHQYAWEHEVEVVQKISWIDVDLDFAMCLGDKFDAGNKRKQDEKDSAYSNEWNFDAMLFLVLSE